MKIRTLQFEIQRSTFQTMNEISKNIVSPSVTLFEKGTHVERAGSVLNGDMFINMQTWYQQKLNFFFAQKKFLCLKRVRIFLLLDIWTLLQNFFNHIYTIAACNPLYPNVVILEDGSFQ